MKTLELKHIELNIKLNTKDEIFDFLATKMYSLARITSIDDFKKALLKREKEVTTGIGEGIAIPHTKDISVLFPTLLYLRLDKSVDYDALDKLPVTDIFLIAMPNSYQKEHLEMLSKIATMLLEKKEALLKLTDKQEIFDLINTSIK